MDEKTKKENKLTILPFGEKYWKSYLSNLTSQFIMPIKRHNTSSCNYHVLNHVLGTCHGLKVSYFLILKPAYRPALTSCVVEDTDAGYRSCVMSHGEKMGTNPVCVLSVSLRYQILFPKNMLIFLKKNITWLFNRLFKLKYNKQFNQLSKNI